MKFTKEVSVCIVAAALSVVSESGLDTSMYMASSLKLKVPADFDANYHFVKYQQDQRGDKAESPQPKEEKKIMELDLISDTTSFSSDTNSASGSSSYAKMKKAVALLPKLNLKPRISSAAGALSSKGSAIRKKVAEKSDQIKNFDVNTWLDEREDRMYKNKVLHLDKQSEKPFQEKTNHFWYGSLQKQVKEHQNNVVIARKKLSGTYEKNNSARPLLALALLLAIAAGGFIIYALVYVIAHAVEFHEQPAEGITFHAQNYREGDIRLS